MKKLLPKFQELRLGTYDVVHRAANREFMCAYRAQGARRVETFKPGVQ